MGSSIKTFYGTRNAFSGLLIMAVVAFLLVTDVVAQSKESSGKARTVVGEVLVQKSGKGKWVPVQVGTKVKQLDKIRTAVESSVQLEFSDASSISIEENTIVELSTLFADGKINQTKVDIKTGKLLFNIQKLTSSRSSFEFQTGTATAAIRGTAGGIGSNGRRTFAYLESGRLVIKSNTGGASITLEANQFAMEGNGKFNIIPKPSDPKELRALIEKINTDSTGTTLDSLLDSLSSILPSEGLSSSISQSSSSAIDVPMGTCTIDPVPGIVPSARLSVRGTCGDGGKVSIGAFTGTASGGRWTVDIAWPGNQLGPKSFPVTCTMGEQEIACGDISFDYQLPKVPLALNLATPRSVNVCQGPVLLSGTYQGNNTKLTAKLGTRILDLSNATGSFTRSIPVSDMERNWDEQVIELLLAGDEGSLTEEIRLAVDKSCKDVNRLPPIVTGQVDGTLCQGVLNISAVKGDVVKVTRVVDGSEVEELEFTNEVRGRRYTLEPGMHDYVIKAVDLAGNSASQEFRKIGCWPEVGFNVSIDGPAREVLRVPPPPPGQSRGLERTVRLSIRNLPSDDWRFIDRIIVKLDGALVRELKGTQIDRVDFEFPASLKRGATNRIHVEVVPKSGRSRHVYKEFDFR